MIRRLERRSDSLTRRIYALYGTYGYAAEWWLDEELEHYGRLQAERRAVDARWRLALADGERRASARTRPLVLPLPRGLR
jgi:hypothetical protein